MPVTHSEEDMLRMDRVCLLAALRDLVAAVEADANERNGIGGYLGARLTDARQAIKLVQGRSHAPAAAKGRTV